MPKLKDFRRNSPGGKRQSRTWSGEIDALESRLLLAAYFVNSAVATNGNGSAGTPFKTIQAAANVVNPGDIVNVLPGTYNEKILLTRSGSAAAPITFRASGGDVVVTSTAVGSFEGMIDIRGDNIVFDGIDVRNSGFFGYIVQGIDITTTGRATNVTIKNAYTQRTNASGIYVKYGGGILLLNNKIEDACISPVSTVNSQECITFTETDGFEVAGNEIWNTTGNNGPSNGGEGIDAKGSSSNGLIRDNFVHDLADVGIYLDSGSKQGTGANDDRPMSNIVVTRNIVRDTGHGIVVASENGGTVDTVSITNNLVYNNDIIGIWIAGYLQNGPRNNILIANNTVHNNGYLNPTSAWGGGIDVHTLNYTNIRIRNNIATNNKGWQIAQTAQGGGTPPAGQLTVTNNIASAFAYSYWYPQPATVADPKYVNAAAGDFRLQGDSPAINFGTSLEAPGVDLANAIRNSQPEVGAYEYVVTLPTSNATGYDFAARQAVTFAFDKNASAIFSRSDFTLQNLTTGQPVASNVGTLSFANAGTTATLLLTNLIGDGNYRLTYNSADVLSPGGVPTSLTPITFDFYVLGGDANRDRKVDTVDFNILLANFGGASKTFSQGNFDYDDAGLIRSTDFNALVARFGASVPAPPPAAMIPAPVSSSPGIWSGTGDDEEEPFPWA